MSDNRIKLCSQLIDEANNYDTNGDHKKADQLTKIAKQLTNKEISTREAINFGRMFGGLTGGLAGAALAPMFSRQRGGLDYALGVLRTKRPEYFNSFKAQIDQIKAAENQLAQQLQPKKDLLAKQMQEVMQFGVIKTQPPSSPVATPPVTTPPVASASKQ
jgi:hypothetical protein